MADTLARRYGTDPLTVASWDPVRLAFAVSCAAAGVAAQQRAEAEAKRGR